MLILVEKDTEPTVLEYAVAGVPVNITTGYAFTIHIGYATNPLAKAAVIHDGPKGLIRFEWQSADLKPGDYDGEILVKNTVSNTERTLKTEKIRILARIPIPSP